MRMSCNGCRVLRKGCSDACTIRPCLQWIKTPEAQANATVFLAKFYGRAGLLNLLAAAPADHLRPAVFRSLLYEACGRIVNPVYGSVGLLWSGQWQACQQAVEAVLKGDPVVQVDAASDAAAASPPLRAPGAAACYDIRHVSKDPDAAAAADLLRVARGGRTRFKRSAAASSSATSSKPTHHHKQGIQALRQQRQEPEEELEEPAEPMVVDGHDEESAGSHDHHLQAGSEDTDDVDGGSHVSQAEAEAEPVISSQQVPAAADQEEEEDVVGLELTLGFEPAAASARQTKAARPTRCDLSAASTLIGLQLELPA